MVVHNLLPSSNAAKLVAELESRATQLKEPYFFYIKARHVGGIVIGTEITIELNVYIAELDCERDRIIPIGSPVFATKYRTSTREVERLAAVHSVSAVAIIVDDLASAALLHINSYRLEEGVRKPDTKRLEAEIDRDYERWKAAQRLITDGEETSTPN